CPPSYVFFFQAEDGIRYFHVTGVQTCALPIFEGTFAEAVDALNGASAPILALDVPSGLDADTGRVMNVAVRADVTITFVALKQEIGRASCRERLEAAAGAEGVPAKLEASGTAR